VGMDEVTRQLCLEGGRKDHPRYGVPDSFENEESVPVGACGFRDGGGVWQTRQRCSIMGNRAAAVGGLGLV
jgi:hypothetical protein